MMGTPVISNGSERFRDFGGPRVQNQNFHPPFTSMAGNPAILLSMRTSDSRFRVEGVGRKVWMSGFGSLWPTILNSKPGSPKSSGPNVRATPLRCLRAARTPVGCLCYEVRNMQ